MRTGKVLAILLALALLTGLVPSALAEHTHTWVLTATRVEPTCTQPGTGLYSCNCGERKMDTIPALGHKWGGWATTQAATCGKAGTQTRTCSRCGKTETQSVPATGKHSFGSWKITQQADCLVPGTLSRSCYTCGYTETQVIPAPGHKWGEGEIVKEAGYLEEGEIVYTCGNNPAHTKTETIPVLEAPEGQSIMQHLRSGSGHNISVMNSDLPLIISKQPEGASITRDSGETVPLSVEAMGGEKPYTYQWKKVYTGNCVWRKLLYMMPTSSFRIISGATESTYDADSGDFAYYCVVKDNAGNSVSSERAETGWKLRIGQQPENRNLFGENSVTLTCAAADGSPFGEEYALPYAYYWFDTDGNLLPYRDDGTAEITEEGEYYCVAEDSAHNTVTSGTAIVYSAEPMTLADLNDRVLKEGETDEIKASVTGGVPPYTYLWSKWGPTGGTAVGDDTDTLSVSCEDSGSYILDVFDSMGAYDWQTFSVSQYKEPLTIARTDFSSEITNQKDASIKVEIVAGTAPYTYTLLNEGTEQESKTSYGTSASFTLSEPSWYAVRIQDSEDRSAETEYMQAGDARLRILEHPKGVTKKYNPSSLESVHLVCKAAGHPDHLLKYQWQGKTGSGWTTLNSSWLNYLDMEESISNHTFYSLHGAYRCVVTDTATGESIISDEAPILFSMEATAAQEGESTTLTVKVDGGTYPYTIKAYQTAYRYGYWDPRYPNSKYFEKITYEYFFPGGVEQRIDRHSVTFIIHDVERFIKGGDIKEACTYTFYITDINGQTVKAKVTCRF